MKINDLGISIIRESAVLDKIDTAGVALMENEIKNILESADSIEPVKMNIEMVRLYEKDDSYYIELDELHKFCEANDMSSINALNAIGDYYNTTCPVALDATNFFVAIESEDTYNNLARLASGGDITAASILESIVNEIKTLKENKVTVKKIKK